MTGHKNGFTLVEIAIVLVIVGLIIGGILKGGDMIQNARINATIADVTSIQAGIRTFRDRYSELPGDISSARTRLNGCTAASFCENGEGNAIVGQGSDPNLGTVVSDQQETVQFWKHLALADIITGVNTSANWAVPVLGQTHPKAPINNAAFEYFYGAPMFGLRAGHVLRMTGNIVTSASGTDVGAVSPHIAAQFERKIDDGNVATGKLIVWDYGDQGCDNRLDGTSGTDETIEGDGCVLLFRTTN